MPERSDMSSDRFPHEFVPKTKPGASTDVRLFGYNVEEFPALQVPFQRLTWFVDQPREAFIHPDQTLIATSMEQNERLIGRTPEDEFERLLRLDGTVDVYFPGDRWVMESDEVGRRELLREIERSVEGQKALYRMVEDAGLDVELYPTIVGWKPWHYEHCRELFKVFGTKSCAFDGTEYDSKYNLWDDLEDLVETLAPDRIYLNGRVSHEQLLHAPDEVVAFSGKMSILNKIRQPNGKHDPTLLTEVINKRIGALHSSQTALDEFMVNH
ncbi:hypothetical protein PN419_02710 [Halorubrum ezzemoulense]|uniref:hypothetical protein n=1 Tax=Halorubrum ezzemoulense TaxID=337243 RepID=UPI00232B86F7|nr:hypothetical protein [Halorubrum ezzemoulense]MDB9247923.1 hypothetical protein [Halorubrum ezzemoulense]MDB9258168.1 hypothetical protein [Halorubrum ezzemoulense]MDB9261470.1 hypothetical protein [Halorubrum ezzemoulense]MDB9264973.1 hypothetical protein [Halorubrum ezzemoulense]MDB9268529.1 hypothetical protein [Halorubrum ezzemoulense]